MLDWETFGSTAPGVHPGSGRPPPRLRQPEVLSAALASTCWPRPLAPVWLAWTLRMLAWLGAVHEQLDQESTRRLRRCSSIFPWKVAPFGQVIALRLLSAELAALPVGGTREAAVDW